MKYQRKNLYYFFSFISVLTLISLTFTLIAYFGAINEGRKIDFGRIAVPLFVGFYLWGVFFPLIFYITKHFGFGGKHNLLRSLLFQTIFAVFFSIIHFTVQTAVAWMINPVLQEHYPNLPAYLWTSFLGGLYLGLPFYALLVFAAQTFISHRKAIAEEKKSAELQSELAQAQLKALKMQLQPHFLFNTLNSISSLVLTDPPAAYEMIAKLGDFLRLTLDHNEDQMVLISEEIHFLRAYLEIEQVRFSDRLKVNFEIENEVLNAVVPHLVLQPIVENSIKHAISKRTAGGTINIEASKIKDKLYIRIQDNGAGNETATKSVNNNADNRTGLTNVRSRLTHYYADNFDLEINKNIGDNGTSTIFRLPLEFDLTKK